jgi:hypothetical protein
MKSGSQDAVGNWLKLEFSSLAQSGKGQGLRAEERGTTKVAIMQTFGLRTSIESEVPGHRYSC